MKLEEFQEPLAEPANGKRGVGVKVDVGEKSALPPPDNMALFQAVVRPFRPLLLLGLVLRGLEFDSFWEGAGRGGSAILRPAL